jgi:hypothetical protein
MINWLNKKSTPSSFWTWLGKNTTRIQSDLAHNPHNVSNEIHREFKHLYPDLTWEVSLAQSEDRLWVFCISADGKHELFPQVIEAIRQAPELPGWTIQGFRPRGSLTVEIEMGDRTLGYEDIWCSVQPLEGGVSVTLFVRGFAPQLEQIMCPAILILLDNAVGEYDAVMKIVELDLKPLPQKLVRKDDFFPLIDLPSYLDSIEINDRN